LARAALVVADMSNRWFLRPIWRCAAICALLAAATPPDAAKAQLALPGAVAPSTEGSVAEGVTSLGPKKKRIGGEDGVAGPAIAPKPPGEDSIAGKPLYLDGVRSVAEFQRSGGETRLSRLTLVGDRISRSGETCRVEATEDSLKLTARESQDGLRRYQVQYSACPFSFEVLEGAVLVTKESGACAMIEADCRVDPNGLWGMGESEFDPKTAKDMLSRRARVEKTLRADFRALYEKVNKDKALRRILLEEQAGFSARREEICRNYAQEADFGYCALRVTEAHALKLGTELAKGVKRPADLAAEASRPGKGRKARQGP
jgi:hypothetical protein